MGSQGSGSDQIKKSKCHTNVTTAGVGGRDVVGCNNNLLLHLRPFACGQELPSDPQVLCLSVAVRHFDFRMSVLCLCGVCIPYSVFWPILLLFLRPILPYFQAFFGIGKEKCDQDKAESGAVSCCAGKKEKSGTFTLGDDDDWSSIANGGNLTFVRFTASWCGPCKIIEPTFLKLGAQNPDVAFVSIDVDKFDEIAATYSAFSIPLFVAIRSGKVLGRLSGKDEGALQKFVKETTEKEGDSTITSDQNLKLD